MKGGRFPTPFPFSVLASEIWGKISMLTQVLWWTCNALIALLLVRAVSRRLFARYLAFYFYLSLVLSVSVLRFYLYTFEHQIYAPFYWYSEFLSIAMGYGIIWEIYERTLTGYPGSLQMARWLVGGVFVIILGKALLNGLTGPAWGSAKNVLELERDFKLVQAILLLLIFGVLTYYLIPIGRNLRGMIVGYGFYVGTGLISMTVASMFGDGTYAWWRYIPPATYLCTLLFWSASLWSYHPNPVPTREVLIEHDYVLLSTRTAQAVSRARAEILRGVRG
jgi:hypothetical protein